jgi:uncharacterized membrane protein YcaP (DUF421 family)
MPATLDSIVTTVLGPDGDPIALTALQMLARAVLIYLFGLAILRAAGHRVLGRYAAIDILTGIVLGSVLSRAVNGTAPFGLTLLASAGIVAAHWALTAAACRWPGLSALVKGRPALLIRDGRLVPGTLPRHHLGAHDLEEALRLSGHASSPDGVAEAWLERNGRISVVGSERRSPPLREDPAPGA